MEEEEEKFSEDPTENMKIENEFLKIKLKAQYGDGFFMQEGDHAIPPDLENQFLKQMMNFEENYEKAEYITLYEKIGKPEYKKIEVLSENEIAEAIISLTIRMEEHGILLDLNDGPYPDEVIYKFITEELFEQEIEKESFFGGQWHFSYEEFHPNDRKEIEKNTHEFLQHWFSKGFDEYSTELAYHFITADGKQLNREAFFKQVNMFFDSFVAFNNDGYNIDEIKFELHADDDAGMGHSEGVLKYDAEMENGEMIHYEGPFKLYMQREDKYWSIMYFVMPGFVW
jgi:hypothetical protein